MERSFWAAHLESMGIRRCEECEEHRKREPIRTFVLSYIDDER